MCEYYVHEDCKDFAVNDCRETANYVPSRDNVSSDKDSRSISIEIKSLVTFHSQPHPFDSIIIGEKEICQRTQNALSVEKHVGPVNVLLVCDANGAA